MILGIEGDIVGAFPCRCFLSTSFSAKDLLNLSSFSRNFSAFLAVFLIPFARILFGTFFPFLASVDSALLKALLLPAVSAAVGRVLFTLAAAILLPISRTIFAGNLPTPPIGKNPRAISPSWLGLSLFPSWARFLAFFRNKDGLGCFLFLVLVVEEAGRLVKFCLDILGLLK